MRFSLGVLALLVVSVFQMGCDNDDDLMVSEEQIEGTWDLTNFSMNDGRITITDQQSRISGSFTFESFDEMAQMTFTTNPNTYSSNGTFEYITTLDIANESTVDTTILTSFLGNGTWELDGNTITLMPEDQIEFPTELEVARLTDTELSLRIEFNERVDIFTVITVTTGRARIDFER